MLLILSSPSGVGKTTIAKKLEKLNFERVVTYTSRARRPNEIDGVDYFFIDKEGFKKRVSKGFFIEHSLVHDNYYGIANDSLKSKSKHKILTIDVQGAKKIKQIMSNALSVFLLPPSFSEWMMRINNITRNNFDIRMKNAIKELDAVWEFDYAIVNKLISETVEQIGAIVFCEEARRKQNIEELIIELKSNIKDFSYAERERQG